MHKLRDVQSSVLRISGLPSPTFNGTPVSLLHKALFWGIHVSLREGSFVRLCRCVSLTCCRYPASPKL